MLEIRGLQEKDILPIAGAFELIGWNKSALQYRKYLSEQEEGRRVVLVAFEENEFVGYLTIVWESKYPPFNTQKTPEIKDFNVLPKARRKGVGTRLMDAAEKLIAERSATAGIGVGLTADYGPAQRLYVSRGYVPDGNGIVWCNRFPKYGEMVAVGDDLILHLTKKLR